MYNFKDFFTGRREKIATIAYSATDANITLTGKTFSGQLQKLLIHFKGTFTLTIGTGTGHAAIVQGVKDIIKNIQIRIGGYTYVNGVSLRDLDVVNMIVSGIKTATTDNGVVTGTPYTVECLVPWVPKFLGTITPKMTTIPPGLLDFTAQWETATVTKNPFYTYTTVGTDSLSLTGTLTLIAVVSDYIETGKSRRVLIGYDSPVFTATGYQLAKDLIESSSLDLARIYLLTKKTATLTPNLLSATSVQGFKLTRGGSEIPIELTQFQNQAEIADEYNIPESSLVGVQMMDFVADGKVSKALANPNKDLKIYMDVASTTSSPFTTVIFEYIDPFGTAKDLPEAALKEVEDGKVASVEDAMYKSGRIPCGVQSKFPLKSKHPRGLRVYEAVVDREETHPRNRERAQARERRGGWYLGR